MKQRRTIRRCLAALLAAVLLLAFIPATIAETFSAFVKSGSMAVYADPALMKQAGVLERYTVVNVLAYKGSVAQVSYMGATGYARISDMTPVAQVAKPAVVAADTRIYAKASTSSASVKVGKGTRVNVIATVNGVSLVEKDGYGGYIASKYLADPAAAQAATPVPTTAPQPTATPAPAAQTATAKVPAVVTAESVVVYNTSGQRIATLSRGETVNVVQVNDQWAIIERDGNFGICLIASLTPQSAVQAAATPAPTATPAPAVTAGATAIPATVTAEKLEVRDASGKLLGTLSKGAQVDVLAIWDSTYALIELNGNRGICLLSGLRQAQTAESQAQQSTGASASIEAEVTAASVQVYNGVGKLLGTLKRGTRVQIIAVNGQWAMIEKDGNKGICLLSALGKPGSAQQSTPKIETYATPIAAVANTAVKVYDISGKTLGTIPKGTSVKVLAVRDGKWALIDRSGYKGICLLSALTPVSQQDDTPQFSQDVFTATVITAGAKLYQKASTSSASVPLPLGMDVTVGAYNETWAYVNVNGVKGYILLSALSRTAYSTLERGSSGENVGKLQAMLLALGYFDGLPGSSFDSATETAVKRFQEQLGRSATGKADAGVLRILMSGAAPACTLLNGKYAKGSTGSSVTRIQTRLYVLGYLSKSASVDGDYGATTQTAVKYFQAANGITASGTADSETLKKLYSLNAAKLPSGVKAADAETPVQTPVSAGDQANNSTKISDKLASTTSTLSSNASNAEKIEYIIYLGQNKLGRPYVYGSNGPSSFDCTGFTCWCYKQLGIKLQRSAYNQGYDNTYPKISSASDLRRGDLVFFNTISDSDLSDHAGIYLGAGYFIHCSSGQDKVVVSSLTTGYYNRVFSWGRRVLN